MDDQNLDRRAVSGGLARPPDKLLCLRFGGFELDLRTDELRRDGQSIRLGHQPLRVLRLLALRWGELVSRTDLFEAAWGSGTFVDFDTGLRRCIREIRAALGDDARAPRFIETLSKRGYRFVAAVEEVKGPSAGVEGTRSADTRPAPRRAGWGTRSAALAAAVAAVLGAVLWPQAAGHEANARRRLLLVLPFENLSGDPEQAYLADSLTDELIVELGRSLPSEVGVLARTTAMQFRGRTLDVALLRRQLGVDHVVEGSVAGQGRRLNVRVSLVESQSRATLWAQRFEGDLTDLPSMQESVARAVAARVLVDLRPSGPPPRPVDPAAYELYLRGLHLFNERTDDALRRAADYLSESVQRQPDFPRAHGILAQVQFLQTDRRLVPAEEGVARMRTAAEAALALDADTAEAHVVLAAEVLLRSWDWEAAEASYRRAIAAHDSYATAHHWYGTFLANRCRFEEAQAQIHRAVELDPLSLIVRQAAATICFQAGRLADSEDQLRKLSELDDQWPLGRFARARLLIRQGRPREAVDSMEALASSFGGSPGFLAFKAYAHASAGQAGRARRVLRSMETRSAEEPVSSAYELAAARLAAGDRPGALRALEQAVAERNPSLRYVAVDERFEALHGDERFVDVARRVGLPVCSLTGREAPAPPR